MLDILEAFLDHRQLTYMRVDESINPDERLVIALSTFCSTYIVYCGIYFLPYQNNTILERVKGSDNQLNLVLIQGLLTMERSGFQRG